MEKEVLGIKASVKDGKLIVEVPIDNLVSGFNGNPNKFEECCIDENKKEEFAEYVAATLLDTSDPETGDSHFTKALDATFEEAMEGGEEFIIFDED